MVINSQYYEDSSLVPKTAMEEESWLEEMLFQAFLLFFYLLDFVVQLLRTK